MTDTSNEQSKDPEKPNADAHSTHRFSHYFSHQSFPTSSEHYTYISSGEFGNRLARYCLAFHFARGDIKLDDRHCLAKAGSDRCWPLHFAIGDTAFTASIDAGDELTDQAITARIGGEPRLASFRSNAALDGTPLPTAFDEQKKDAELRRTSSTNLDVMAAEGLPVIRPAQRLKR